MQRQGLESTYLSNCNKLNKVLKLWHTDKPLLLYRCGYSQLIFITMTKEMARDIAIVLVAKSGEQFDSFAFEDSEISERDKEKISTEIQLLCTKMIDKIQSKYNVQLKNSTAEIIDSIVFI